MSHKCPAPNCEQKVPDSMLSCKPHWFALPKDLRDEVWATAHLTILDQTRADVLVAVVEFYAERGY